MADNEDELVDYDEEEVSKSRVPRSLSDIRRLSTGLLCSDKPPS
jgi:hypothetical protein